MTSEPTPRPTLQAFETWAHLFPASDDAAWNALINEVRPSARVILSNGYLTGDYRWSIKARFLALLLTPDSALLPERFHPAGLAYTIYELDPSESRHFSLAIFPHELILFAQDLICESLDTLDQLPIRFDAVLCARLRSWLVGWLEHFMTILSPVESQKSCDRYPLSEPHLALKENGENRLEFLRLRALLTSRDIPLDHKRAIVHRQVHPLIERERAAADRGESVEPIYTRLFLVALYDCIKHQNGSVVSFSFVREEMDFLLLIPAKLGWLSLRFDHDLPYLLRIYEGEEHVAARKTLVLRAFDEAQAQNEEPTAHLGARWKIGVLNEAHHELGEEHPELKALLKRLMEEALPGIVANEDLERKLRKIYEDLR